MGATLGPMSTCSNITETSRQLARLSDSIVWLDCDVIFTCDKWVELANRALDKFALLHLFQERYDLPAI
jgi:hypothetical protein